jgi:hypothetical protein
MSLRDVTGDVNSPAGPFHPGDRPPPGGEDREMGLPGERDLPEAVDLSSPHL